LLLQQEHQLRRKAKHTNENSEPVSLFEVAVHLFRN
jgi:hypothetical protein